MKPSTLQLSISALSFIQNYPVKTKDPVFELNQKTLLTESSSTDMLLGNIPDLYPICVKLLDTFLLSNPPYSALQFIPILHKVRPLSDAEVKRLSMHSDSRHVLIDNNLLKIVLIHWRPGDSLDLHGHHKQECVITVLNGSLEVQRYSTSKKQILPGRRIIHSGSQTYIENSLGYYSVIKPSTNPTVSIHVYTPGNY
jgi:hypothetical protein